MRLPRCLLSPLAGTAGVLAVMTLLAIPLCRLTSSTPVAVVLDAPDPAAARGLHAVLRLRLLAPAPRVVVLAADGHPLLDMRNLPAGESEHDVMLPLADGGVDLTMVVDSGSGGVETAVFLTVMPDGHEGQTRYVIGSGRIEEALRYEWRHQ